MGDIVIPVGFGTNSKFDDAAKQTIEDAGQALIRGEESAADLLIIAASPLVPIVTSQFLKGYGKGYQWDDLHGEAQIGLVTAVRAIERMIRGGSKRPPPKSFRAYLSACIRNHLSKSRINLFR